jgi:uncharacterized membrane protein
MMTDVLFQSTPAHEEAVRSAASEIMGAVSTAAIRHGWGAAIAALPTVLVPLLGCLGSVAQAQFVLRGLADQAPSIIASWEGRLGPLGPPAGHA